MTKPLVELSGVSVTYPGPPPVSAVRPSDLQVSAGDYLAVMGPSGSGKSTLLDVLGLLRRPTSGQYRFAGLDIGELTDGQRSAMRSRHIGFVFQDFHLLPHRTAYENVMLARLYQGVPRAARHRLSCWALDQVGLRHRAGTLSTRLSGGERQRVAIARALAVQPWLLLCDEPTGNLDTTTARSVLDVIDHVRGGDLAVVMITHDPQVAGRADRMVRIRDGWLTAVGSPVDAGAGRPGAATPPDGDQ